MDDPRRYLSLHTVGMLRELVRKWWRVEIGLADSGGRVLQDCLGPVPPAGNDFCRAVLESSRGRRRCLKSVREIHTRLRNPRQRGPVLHACHLGLSMAAGAIRAQGRDRGLLFACGFSSRDLSRTRINRLRGAVQDLAGRKVGLEGERVPVLGREDIERLKDLLEYGADEMAAYEAGLLRTQTRPPPPAGEAFFGIAAHSAGMRAVVERLAESAPLSTPVLLVGEAGTGKRALARSLHRASPRRPAPFQVFEGSSDPAAAENRLFGISRGPSLGRAGMIETAAPGTVYLCAGSWSPPSIQVKLLRFLQEGTLVPVGGERPVEADTRLALALEGDFDEATSSGRLRRDLAELLAPHRVDVPALRDRREDLLDLIGLLLERHTANKRPSVELQPATVDLLLRYDWPGNAAELEKEIRQLVTLSGKGGEITPENISVRIRQAAGYGSWALTKALRSTQNLKQAIAILEREMIHEGLIHTRWNKSKLARLLGISRSNLLTKLADYGLERDRNLGKLGR